MDKPYIYIFQTQFDSIVKIGKSDVRSSQRLEQHIRTPHHGYHVVRILEIYEINKGTASGAEKVLERELGEITGIKNLGNEVWFIENGEYSWLINKIEKILFNDVENINKFGVDKLHKEEVVKLNKDLVSYWKYDNEKEGKRINLENKKEGNIFEINGIGEKNKIIFLKYRKVMNKIYIEEPENMIVRWEDNVGTLYRIAYLISNGKGINYGDLLYFDEEGKKKFIQKKRK